MQKIYKLLNIYFPLRDFLYILQLEEYNIPRYLHQVRLRIFLRNFEKLQSLSLTWRIKILALLTVGIILLVVGILSLLDTLLGLIFFAFFLPAATPLLLFVASICIQPITYIASKYFVAKAHAHFLTQNPNTKVIAITGSFGKTTTKYLLFELLQHTYRTAMIPKNINTALGIANYILQGNVPPSTKYLVVEMGAYKQGDIKEACRVVCPDISLITALADQHMERFGSFRKLVLTKNEIFDATPNKQSTFAPKVVCETLKEHGIYDPETNCVDVNIPYPVPILTNSPELANSIALAYTVAKSLGVTDSFIQDTLEKVTLPDRRKDHKFIDGIEVIDNSYNISPVTAKNAIESAATYAKKAGKSLIVITGGISEQGKETRQVNNQLATLLNTHAETVILLNTIFAPYIEPFVKDAKLINESDALAVLNTLSKYADAEKNVVLQLPTHNDLFYL